MRFLVKKLAQKIILISVLCIGFLDKNELLAQVKVYRTNEEDVNNQKLFLEATSQKLLGKYEQAGKLFAALLQKDDKNDAAAYELSRMMEIQNKDDEAIKAAQTAVLLDKKNMWYKMLLADLYQKNNRQKDAAKVYESLAADEPGNEDFYYGWANCLEKLGDAEQAIKIYDKLEKKRGVQEDITRRKHALYLTLNNPKKATQELEKLTAAFPKEVSYLVVLADFYKQQNQAAAARATCEKILKIDPNDSYATMELARGNRAAAGNDVAYLQSLKPLFEKKEINIDVKIKELIPTAQKLIEKPDNVTASAALDLVKILEKVHSDDAKTYAVYGDLLYYNGQKSEALGKYQKAVAINRNIYSIWEQILLIYSELKDYQNLATNSAQLIELFPNQTMPYFLNGKANFELKKYSDADESLSQLLPMVGRNPKQKTDVLFLLGKSSFMQQKYDKTKDFLTKSLSIGGENMPEILENLGDAYAKLNDAENAVNFWKKAQEKGAKSANLSKKVTEKKYYDQ